MTEYKVPERFLPMTLNHMHGISEVGRQANVRAYLLKQGFCLTADLMAQGFRSADIEEAVNSSDIGVAHWPAREPRTDMYWAKDPETLRKLDELANEAVRLCGGQSANQIIGGDFVTIGAVMGSQQRALVGLIYGRETGKLREIPEFDQGAGPLYVARRSFSDQMFAELFPEHANK